jgi:hypothetical protein
MKTFLMRLDRIQPSQFYISEAKLARVHDLFAPLSSDSMEPVPVKKLNGDVIFTDGHTRAFAALRAGLQEIRVFWDEDDLDWEAYAICVAACKKRGIRTIADLRGRTLGAEDYEREWIGWCDVMHAELEAEQETQ